MDFDFIPSKCIARNYAPFFQELNVLEVGYNDLKNIPPFLHMRKQNFYTLHFVLDGTGELTFRDHVYRLKENDMFFLPPLETFKYYPLANNPWKYFWFALSGKTAEKYLL